MNGLTGKGVLGVDARLEHRCQHGANHHVNFTSLLMCGEKNIRANKEEQTAPEHGGDKLFLFPANNVLTYP